MSVTNFSTRNDTYRKLMGNGLIYRIPRFQRDYSWTEEEWEDLWADINGTIKLDGEPAHYMGYLVLQSSDDKTFDVIDGQQRLTTLSLIVLATLKNIRRLIEEKNDADHNQQRLEQIRQTYIGYLDPVTLVSRSKLSLNRNNDNYYQTYIVPLERLPQRGFKASEHGLRKAFEWYDRRVGDYVRQSGKPDEGKTLAQLVDTMSDRLFFTVISVTDGLNAYKVFETLNARGVRLSATDLLKNYLFSVLHRENQHEHEMKNLEDRWESMVGRLGSESFPDFLRTHWNSRRTFVRQTNLFKTIRSQVAGREQAFQLIREMEEDLDAYLGLTQPENSGWSPKLKSYANDLRMFNVRQPYPLILAAKRRFGGSDFESLLRSCVVISFRYNVIGSQPTSEQERVYNQVAVKISDGAYSDLTATLNGMMSLYPSDDSFRTAFTEKIIKTTQSRNRRVVRYILCCLENHVSGIEPDFDSDTFNIEHILPQNPQQGWQAFPDQDLESYIYRIGNMTLLPSSPNREVGNDDYATKRLVFKNSMFQITQRLAEENADWTPERLAARQRWMANQAMSIWRIAQFS